MINTSSAFVRSPHQCMPEVPHSCIMHIPSHNCAHSSHFHLFILNGYPSSKGLSTPTQEYQEIPPSAVSTLALPPKPFKMHISFTRANSHSRECCAEARIGSSAFPRYMKAKRHVHASSATIWGLGNRSTLTAMSGASFGIYRIPSNIFLGRLVDSALPTFWPDITATLGTPPNQKQQSEE